MDALRGRAGFARFEEDRVADGVPSENIVVGRPVAPSTTPESGPVILGTLMPSSDAQKPVPSAPELSEQQPILGYSTHTTAPLPVMLPRSRFGYRSGSRAEVSDYNSDGQGWVLDYSSDRPAWVLAPGHVVAPACGAVSAGPHHKPHGSKGAVIGAVSGLIIGGAPLLAGLGYVLAKNSSRAKHTIEMTDEYGQVVPVKLWKTGKHAPLTEDGYWLVASDPRDSEMEIFIRRVVGRMGAVVIDSDGLHAFVLRHSGHCGLSSFARLLAELTDAPWIGMA